MLFAKYGQKSRRRKLDISSAGNQAWLQPPKVLQERTWKGRLLGNWSPAGKGSAPKRRAGGLADFKLSR